MTTETAVAPVSEPAPVPARREWLPAALLALVLIVATAIRLWGIKQGLPYAYNLDERAHFVPKAVAMTGGDLNPGYFINPPAYTYMVAVWLGVLHLGGNVTQLFADHPGQVFGAARVLSLLLGVAGVAAVYAAGRAWFDRRVGLLAAALLALAFLPVFYSRLALNDGPAMLPCAGALWASALVFKNGSTRAMLAGGTCVGLAAAMKYSDGVVVLALIAAAFASPAMPFKRALLGLIGAGAIAIAVVIVTDPYMLSDWKTFTHDLDRQRKFADGPALIGQPERNGWIYYAKSFTWSLGTVPALLAVLGGALLLVKRRREAWVFGALIVLFWLYMGSQHRFYARWMLPLFPAMAVLAGYAIVTAVDALPRRFAPAALAVGAAILLIPTALPTIRNAGVMAKQDTRTATRNWLVAHVPRNAKVVFEPIAPTEWYGVTAGAGPKADPARQWQRYNRSKADIAELAKEFRGAKRKADFENYERTLTPGLIDLYRREGYCWVVTGSTQYGRALAEPKRVPHALAYYRALKRDADVAYRISPVAAGDTLPRYQVDRSFNYIDSAFQRPGPEMVVYKLRNCS